MFVFQTHRTRTFVRRACRHAGRVVAKRGSGFDGDFTIVTVQFESIEGTGEVEVELEFWPPAYGERVEILYDALNNQGRLDGFWRIWGSSALIFALALLFFMMAFGSP